MFSPKPSLIFAVGLVGLVALNARAESAVAESSAPVAVPTAPSANPAIKPSGIPGPGARPASSMMGGQPALTPEENKILTQARTELQKDPELTELTAQIKALMEKRTKLMEEKLQKISPEAAAIVQKLKDAQEKMQAERRAQMEAMQAKYKAQQEEAAAKKSAPATDKPEAAPANPTAP